MAKFGLCDDWFLKKRVNHEIMLHEVGKTFFVNPCVQTVPLIKYPGKNMKIPKIEIRISLLDPLNKR